MANVDTHRLKRITWLLTAIVVYLLAIANLILSGVGLYLFSSFIWRVTGQYFVTGLLVFLVFYLWLLFNRAVLGFSLKFGHARVI